MYCFVMANNIPCIVNELYLWSDISSEHPIFIKTVAELTKKDLPKEVIDKLMEVNKMFTDINKKVEDYAKAVSPYPYMTDGYITQLSSLVDEFLLHDTHILQLLPELKEFGKEDKVWQTLLEHITEEQTFMYELFCSIRMQMY